MRIRLLGVLFFGLVLTTPQLGRAQDDKPLPPGWLSLDGSVGLADRAIADAKGSLESALGVTIGGFFDAGYMWSSNHPRSPANISLRYFDKDYDKIVFNNFHVFVEKPEKDWGVGFRVSGDFGRTGELLRELPRAKLMVHPRGAPHLVDPAKLVASARQVYGDELFDRAYGGLVPVPAHRVLEAADGQVVELAGRPLLLAHTPGHALHHLSVWDARSRGWFTGDSFGISYRELDVGGRPFAIPTTSPMQFDPGQMKDSIRRMLLCDS